MGLIADIGIAHLDRVSGNSKRLWWRRGQNKQSRKHKTREIEESGRAGSHTLGILAEHRLAVILASSWGELRSQGEATWVPDLVRSV